MKIMVRLVLLAVIIAGGIWLWTIFFPAPQKIIRQRLAEVARNASFNADESPFVAIGKAQKLAGLFNTNLEISLDEPEHFQRTFDNRQEIAQVVAGVRAEISSLTVKFLDVTVTIGADKKSATADMTVQAQAAGQKDFVTQEMKFTFQKVGGEWLITRVETVRTLT